MRHSICLVLFFFMVSATTSLLAQTSIDSSFAFQADAAKRYSLYIPSSYKVGTPAKLMLGLHPLNTSRWNAQSWRDTLIVFAETNNLLLVCPDGGSDGRIDDPIDTAFTSTLLDSVMAWYTADKNKIFVMGFSWGGRTTYSYGLEHHTAFAGFLPIGAAIDGAESFAGILPNAKDKPFYILHGGSDNPNQGFYPMKTALEKAGALVHSKLLPGVGHTIDFSDRNMLLTVAFRWLDSVSTAHTVSVREADGLVQWSIAPNPSMETTTITYQPATGGYLQVSIADALGRVVRKLFRGYAAQQSYTVQWDGTDEYGNTVAPGMYQVIIRTGNGKAKSLPLLKK